MPALQGQQNDPTNVHVMIQEARIRAELIEEALNREDVIQRVPAALMETHHLRPPRRRSREIVTRIDEERRGRHSAAGSSSSSSSSAAHPPTIPAQCYRNASRERNRMDEMIHFQESDGSENSSAGDGDAKRAQKKRIHKREKREKEEEKKVDGSCCDHNLWKDLRIENAHLYRRCSSVLPCVSLKVNRADGTQITIILHIVSSGVIPRPTPNTLGQTLWSLAHVEHRYLVEEEMVFRSKLDTAWMAFATISPAPRNMPGVCPDTGLVRALLVGANIAHLFFALQRECSSYATRN